MRNLRERLHQGGVIPAHPLALTAERKLDERRQRALTRYYLAAGAAGVAVGVHTTQFAIRDVGLFQPVLDLAMEELRRSEAIKVAGVCGRTAQAVREAELAASLGYETALVSLGALREAPTPELLEHVRTIASILPVFGFYLQPAVGGRILPDEFWRGLCDIENVVAIKIAPFNRYQTLDVVRAVADSSRAADIALYTGNDDNIVIDLMTEFRFPGRAPLSFSGGLLGHWAVWTRRAVECVERLRCESPSSEWLTLAAQVTDANAAFFDPEHQFQGSIAGIHEVLRRQGLLAGRWCLDPREDLSPGQHLKIDRVYNDYSHLNDDDFVRERLDGWLR